MRRRPNEERRSLLAAAAFVLVVAVVAYVAFASPSIGHKYTLKAVVKSSNQLRSGSPVRIAGVNVGQVTKIGPGPGATSTLTMRIDKRGQPLHADATLKIRPRLFLEGGFYVDLKAGSPSAPALHSDSTLPLGQTAVPVQLNDLLSTFDQPARRSFKHLTAELHTGVAGGGARSLRTTAPNVGPALRDLAWVAAAARGTRPDDVSALVGSASRVTRELASRRDDLAGLVTNLDRTAAALSANDRALGSSVDGLDRVLRDAPPALAGVDGALPTLRQFSRVLAPALKGAPAVLRQARLGLDELATVVTGAGGRRLVRALRVTLTQVPNLVTQLGALFDVTRPVTDCLGANIAPVLTTTVPDGALSTNRPVWQDLAHAFVGLSSIAQNFDANGYAIRFNVGLAPQNILALDSVPGVGQVVSTSAASSPGATAVTARPAPLAKGAVPPLRPDVPCTANKVPNLATPTQTTTRRAIARSTPSPALVAKLRRELKLPRGRR